ncbi:cytochrome P450 [Nocardioides dongxiaopingii]|uniref:cytochrome P450 n=1 Tax=Nocardioides sp. S-1144 TaxID=2582905 RepID=UPI00110E4387|nr:cytochrome P450 [Nocardioides sp. S-1144]QCW52266.1 cytochrome P450 [Nocardioides sp. S-1144]
MRFVEAVKQRAGKFLLERTMRDGIDLRKMRFLPSSVTMPLKRDGLDPLPEMAAIRATEPVTKLATLFGKNIWLVSGYDEARAALADGTSYSNDIGQFVSQEGRSDEDQIGGLGMTDPPLHTALRRYLTPEFTMRRLARLEPEIERVVHERLDAMEAAGPHVDLVKEFAFPVPFQVICELLGLPVEDRERFFELGVARFDLSQGGVGAFGAAAHTRDFLIKAVAAQRAEPGDGLIGGLLKEHGDELDDLTLGGIADGVFLGGYETSASMLSLGAYLLAENPDAMAMLRDDSAGREHVDRIVEELLRHLTVVQLAFLRFAKVDLELGGKQISAGDAVGISLLGANRDPAVAGADPDTFDPHRPPTRHLAFGHGMHRCVGAELARMELRIALRALATRFPDLAVTAPRDTLDFRKLSAVYGVEALPVDLHGAGDRVPAGR